MRPRIQIIDDNVALSTLLAKALTKFDYDPVVENNPLLAINTVRHYMPDLILLDVMMPERDGGRVLADLRNDLSLRYIPVILLTAIAREAQTLANTGGIQSTVLSKPVQLRELIETIASHINDAKTYNQLQADNAEETGSAFHFQELPDFDAGEGPLSLPTEKVVTSSSVSFSEHFPSREESPPRTQKTSGFSFPSRPDHEKPGGSVW